MSAADLSCREAVELFSDFLDGLLPAELAALCEAHLRECTGCMRYLEQLRVSVAALRSLDRRLDPECRATLLRLFRESHQATDE